MSGEDRKTYLEVANLTKVFGTFVALEDISLDVLDGEFVCFLGPSGCGKTTLLRAIAGLDIQTSGTVTQAGRDISALPPSERDFGIVFQSYALFPNLSVRRNVGYGLENKKMPKADITARVDELLGLVGLTEHDNKYPAQLSGGQQQRVALARAIATSPGLLLLDEPLSALDAKVRVHLRQEIKGLQDKLGITTIMVTHDQEEALAIADRIVVMRDGVIEQIGTPHEIYANPASPFVADFIGTTNFIEGEVLADGRIATAGVVIEGYGDTARLSPGQNVTICIRPEDILVAGVKGDDPQAFEVTVTSMEFLGAFHRCHLIPKSGNGAGFDADLSANLARRLGVETGRSLHVTLPPDLMRVYEAGAAGS